MLDILRAEKIVSGVWINMFTMMTKHFRNILCPVFLSTACRMFHGTVRKPQWNQLRTYLLLPSHPTLVLPCQGGNLVDVTWSIIFEFLVAVSYQLFFTRVPVDFSVTPSRGSLRIKVRLSGLMVLDSPLCSLFSLIQYSGLSCVFLKCSEVIANGSQIILVTLRNPLNYMTPYEFQWLYLIYIVFNLPIFCLSFVLLSSFLKLIGLSSCS